MLGVLTVPDEVVISFFSACVVAQSVAILILWKKQTKCEEDRAELWKKLADK